MSSMTENIVVGVVVAVAGFWAARAVWRSVRGGKICSTCSSSEGCPMAAQQNNLVELGPFDQCGPQNSECPSAEEKPDNT